MSEEQLAALLVRLKEDKAFQERLRGAADLDAAVLMAQEAGFNVSPADWRKEQALQALELNDDELEEASGGTQITDAITQTNNTKIEKIVTLEKVQ